MKYLIMISLLAVGALADVEVIEKPHSISMESNGKTLWTFNHDPAEGKPYFHPLSSSDGTMFTDLRPKDHPWHRGVWFSWKYINGVNYWEENRETGQSDGETRIVNINRRVSEDKNVHIATELEYAPAGTAKVIMKESRRISISSPAENGLYHINWSSRFQAVENDVVLDRTPLPNQPKGKNWGGYAGYSLRMTEAMTKGFYINSEGLSATSAHRQPSNWLQFTAPSGGSVLFMDHPSNINSPAKWYVTPHMAYISPSVIHDAPYTIKAGETLTLKYQLVISPKAIKKAEAKVLWEEWVKAKLIILTGANNHQWQTTTPVLKQIMESSGKFDVQVVEDPELLTEDFLADFDVLLSNRNAFGEPKPAPWSKALKSAYVKFVHNGGGHIAVHAGSSSFYDWDDYHAICLATWKDGTGHKKPHEFEVRISDQDHPISPGLENFKTTDELWFKPFVHSNAAVIAESFSQHTGNWEPTAFAGQFGRGRCYTLLLGHSAAFMQNEGFKAILTSGTEWAAKIK